MKGSIQHAKGSWVRTSGLYNKNMLLKFRDCSLLTGLKKGRGNALPLPLEGHQNEDNKLLVMGHFSLQKRQQKGQKEIPKAKLQMVP